MKIKNGMEKEYKEYAKNNSDPYGNAVVRYSEIWADLMEKKIEEGIPLVDIASSTSHEADTEGITGFMYGCAVSSLAHYWIYGEELRRWHNLETQIGKEGEEANKNGGTLNPALLSMNV